MGTNCHPQWRQQQVNRSAHKLDVKWPLAVSIFPLLDDSTEASAVTWSSSLLYVTCLFGRLSVLHFACSSSVGRPNFLFPVALCFRALGSLSVLILPNGLFPVLSLIQYVFLLSVLIPNVCRPSYIFYLSQELHFGRLLYFHLLWS